MKNDPHLTQLVPVALSLLSKIDFAGLQFRPLGLQEPYLLLHRLDLGDQSCFWSMSFNFLSQRTELLSIISSFSFFRESFNSLSAFIVLSFDVTSSRLSLSTSHTGSCCWTGSGDGSRTYAWQVKYLKSSIMNG